MSSPDLTYSKSTISRITQKLDPEIKRWQEEQLKDCYLYLITDALYFFVRVNHQVISCPVLISIGVDQNGHRKIRTTNLIEEVINKDLKQRSGVVGIFPNQQSCLRYVCLRLIEIDEDGKLAEGI